MKLNYIQKMFKEYSEGRIPHSNLLKLWHTKIKYRMENIIFKEVQTHWRA
jgi:hypothetical protein